MLETWERNWSNRLPRRKTIIHYKQFSHLEKLLGGLEGKNVLELGCGTATDSIASNSNYNTEGVSLDYSIYAIKISRYNSKIYRSPISLIRADISKLPFKKKTFDGIYSNGVMEHFKDITPYLWEQKRILKNGGVIVIGAPYAFTLYQVKRALLSLAHDWKYGWERGMTLRQQKKAYETIGMEIIDYYFDSHPRWHLPKKLNGTIVNFINNGGIVTFAMKKD